MLARNAHGQFLPRRRRGGAGRRRSARRRNPTPAYRAGYDAVFGKSKGLGRRLRASTKARARARSMARDRFGHFVKRRAAPKRRKARRSAKRRAAPRRRHTMRSRRGRFSSRYTPKYTRRAQRRKGVRKHLRAIRSISAHSRVAGLVRLNPRTGEIIMSRATVANPRRKRRNSRRRTTSLATVANKRRRRRSRRRNPSTTRRRNPRVRSNPGGALNTLKTSAVPMGMGALGGAVVGFVDAKFLNKMPMVTILSKVLLGVGGAMALRKKPLMAMGWAGGCFGSLGYAFGVKMGGGIVAHSSIGALQGIADMADEDPEMAAMLAGMGDVVSDDMGDAGEYEAALGDVVDDMGDVVESYDE